MKTELKYRGRKRLIPYNQHEGLGHHTYWNWKAMPYGYKRRNAILQYLRAHEGTELNYIAINKKWCIILKRDPDLKRLLKQGKLWMDKVTLSSYKHAGQTITCTMSVLRLVK